MRRLEWRTASPVATLVAIVAAVAAIHVARSVLIPVALAAMVSLVLAPLVARCERWGLGRIGSVVVVTVLALGATLGFGWLVARQLTDLAEKLPEYRSNILAKSESLGTIGESLARRWSGLQQLGADVVSSTSADDPAAAAATPTVVVAEPHPTPFQAMGAIVRTLAATLGSALIVLILVVFFLVYRRDLGDRLIHVFGTARVPVTNHAMEEAATNVSRYLLTLTIVNAGYGALIGLTLLALGAPNALLWGLLAAVLRFIPYAGPWLGLVVPLLLCVAVFPTWREPALLVGAWVVLEIVTAHVVEPWAYGTKTIVSPLGVILGALVWTALWGPAGLILAVPMTVSAVVLGRNLQQLAFLNTLFGSDTALDPSVQLYDRLLRADTDAAVGLVDEYRADRTLVEVCDALLLPALAHAETDRHQGSLDDERAAAVMNGMRVLADDVANAPADPLAETRRPAVPHAGCPARVVIVPAADDADEIAALLLRECLAREGCRVETLSPRGGAAEKAQRAEAADPDVVCVSALPPGAAAPARSVVRRIRARMPHVRIVVGLWTSRDDLDRIGERIAGDAPARFVTTIAEVRELLLESGAPRTAALPDPTP